jgi:hypothetical protein
LRPPITTDSIGVFLNQHDFNEFAFHSLSFLFTLKNRNAYKSRRWLLLWLKRDTRQGHIPGAPRCIFVALGAASFAIHDLVWPSTYFEDFISVLLVLQVAH